MTSLNVVELFEQKKSENEFLKISAPMVRYSKLSFRRLVRKYGTDLAFTPMIMSDSFVQSTKSRDVELTTAPSDRPLVVQFAANKVEDFVNASQLVTDHCEGVDLNCGCPQSWACKEGVGACLIEKPEFVSDLVKQTRNRCRNDLSVSVKMRVHRDLNKTVDFSRQLEAAGVTFLTVHGRTRYQKSSTDTPVNLDAIKLVKESVQVPVVANGDVTCLGDAVKTRDATGVDGVMVARALLENPALFHGYEVTPKSCVEDYIRFALEDGTPFTCFHHHLCYMLEKSFSRAERRYFNILTSQAAVLQYLNVNYDVNTYFRNTI